MFAYLYVPGGATVEEAQGWLIGLGISARFGLTSADLGFICRTHALDDEVRQLRAEGDMLLSKASLVERLKERN